jgi:hypothetical protein
MNGEPGSSGRGFHGTLAATAACAVTVVVLGIILLHPYVTNRYRYPLGWDAMLYVWRARAIPVDGLARVGAVRAGFPLLTAVLGTITRQNAFTLVAVLPPVLAGVAGLAAAALVRATFRISVWWVPVIGILTWTAFGTNEIPLHHFDNLLNVALVLAGFATALAFVAGGRGLIAATALFMAAGLAHWPFYLFAMAVFVGGVILFAWWEAGSAGLRPLASGPAGRLLATAGASGAFVGVTLLALPVTGWAGARPGPLADLLKERILARLDDPQRFLAVPLAALGAVAVLRRPPQGTDPRARRLFLSLMAAWAGTTVLAMLAQVAGAPTAGARVLSYFFPLSILTGVLAWWVWRRADGEGPWWRAGAAAVTIAALLGFGSLLWGSWSGRHPWVEADAVREAAAAGRYVAAAAPGRDAVYLIDTRDRGDLATVGRWWLVIKASLPADQVARAHRYVGTPADYLARRPSVRLGEGLPPGESDRPDPDLWGAGSANSPMAIVLERYNRPGFESAATDPGATIVAPGVLVLGGADAGGAPGAVGAVPVADTSGRTLLWTSFLCVAALFLAGSGWALGLLSSDPLLRIPLAPALGAATTTLAALAWGVLRLPFRGWWALGPLVVTAAGGWLAAAAASRRAARAGSGEAG